ncbi:MAG: hypothetical protein NUV50_12505 [Rhodospirillales bacterium]|nr:hypothetical protein [Rhodospirillales bacterium]
MGDDLFMPENYDENENMEEANEAWEPLVQEAPVVTPPRACFNALRHGLFSQTVVLPGEDGAAYERLFKKLKRDLQPTGTLENELVRRIADTWWRMMRVAAIEAGFLNPDWDGDVTPRLRISRISTFPAINSFAVAINESETLDRLGRYEGRLERALARLLATLSKTQEMRRKTAQNRSKTPSAMESSKN